MSDSSQPAAEAARHASFDIIRYAQVWEDADVLLKALNIQPDDVCLSIASAGDNALSMLSCNPQRVIALDLNPSQIACLELRVAAFRNLQHSEILQLLGVNSADQSSRTKHYKKCRASLGVKAQTFWDSHPEWILEGVGTVGKFERYFHLFRTRILPLVHSRTTIEALFTPRTREERERFYEDTFDSVRWRMLFRLFFSRTVMGWMGRDPSFFRYVDEKISVSERILTRARHAATELAPELNPYLQWILLGTYTTALPHYLRPEHFDAIRSNLDKLEWHETPLEAYIDSVASGTLSRFNLSDIFEYMSEENTRALLSKIGQSSRSGARVVYWNMLAPRSSPDDLHHMLRPVPGLGEQLHAEDKAFFYSALRVEEVVK